MGHIYVKALFYNPLDYVEHVRGERKLEDIKKAEVNALVDTSVTFPALPKEMVDKLKLPVIGKHEAEVATGKEEMQLVLATVQVEDRVATSHLIVRPKETTPLIGVVALEQMGYRVDPTTGKLIKGLPLML